jgi:hypothetical protein
LTEYHTFWFYFIMMQNLRLLDNIISITTVHTAIISPVMLATVFSSYLVRGLTMAAVKE